MLQDDLPIILFGLATIWFWGFSVGLEYGIRYAMPVRKDDNAHYSN